MGGSRRAWGWGLCGPGRGEGGAWPPPSLLQLSAGLCGARAPAPAEGAPSSFARLPARARPPAAGPRTPAAASFAPSRAAAARRARGWGPWRAARASAGPRAPAREDAARGGPGAEQGPPRWLPGVQASSAAAAAAPPPGDMTSKPHSDWIPYRYAGISLPFLRFRVPCVRPATLCCLGCGAGSRVPDSLRRASR